MKTRRGPIGRGGSRKSRSSKRPLVERVEDRQLLTTFFVTSAGDSGAGTLRDAITMSNASTTSLPNAIDFSQLQTNTTTITLLSPLPSITASVIIDGTTAPGYSAATPKPTVEIDATRQSTGATLDVATNNVVIQALDIDNFNVSGITLDSGSNNLVAGCYIGTNLAGTTAGTNLGTGILVNAANAFIGGSTPADRNVITGVDQAVQFTAGAANGTVEGNYIGTNAQGTAELGATNSGNGLELDSNSNAVDDNLISGYSYGIQVLGSSVFNTISGNFIGTDFSGNKKIGNTYDGIYINAGGFDTIGTAENDSDTGLVGDGNVISGNGRDGVQVTGDSPFVTLQTNKIGIGADSSTSVGNGFYGVYLNGGGGFDTIGFKAFQTTLPNEFTNEAAAGNVIAFNGAAAPASTGGGGVRVSGDVVFDGIVSNSIYANVGPGIRLNGANNGILPPTLSSASAGGGETKVAGNLFEQARNETYRIQLFSTSTNGDGEGKTFLGDYDVTTDSQGNASLAQILPTQAPIGSYLTATATDTANDSSIFSSPVQIGQAVVSDLAVTVAPAFGTPATPLVGQPYVFAVTVTNNPGNVPNNDDATGVVLTDALPANAVLINADTTPGASLLNGVLTYDIGNLANGVSQVLFIAVRPSTTTGTFSDTATVTSADIDPDITNNTASDTPVNGVQPDAILTTAIATSADPTPVGSPLTYTITALNEGPSTANNSVVTITLDPSFTNLMVNPDQGTYTVDNGVITVKSGIIPSGSTTTITITATPTTVGTFNATSSISSPIINPATGTDTSKVTTVPVTVQNAADLGITVSAPGEILIGQQLLYTLTVTNNGPSTATTPIVGDLLPAGVTFDPSASSDSNGGTLSLSNGVVLDTLQPLDAGTTDTITIAVTPTVSGSITNSVAVADPNTADPSEIDPDPTNNKATATTLVSPADVGVTILNPTDPLTIGTQVAFQVQVYNNGPADATNVSLVDTFGAGAKVINSSAGTIITPTAGDVVTANLGTIASGNTVTVTILVDPTASGTLTDAAAVSSDQIDPNPNDNNTSSTNLVNPVDLAVAVTGVPSSVILGTPVTFTATVTNNGPSTATNVLFNGLVPTGTTFVSAVASAGTVTPSGTTLTGNLGTLASGASATVTITVIPTAIGSVSETASATSDDFDTNTGNDSATSTVTVTNQAGTIEVPLGPYIYAENAGSITLTLNRVDGTLGAVTVSYSTFDGTAKAGLNYTATTGTVTFADGQTTATVTIPVLDDGIVDGTNGFYFGLLSAGGGASLDTNSVAAILLTNVDRDTTPPVVTNLTAIPNGTSFDGFVLTFSKALNISTATNVANYDVFLSNHDAGKGQDTVVPLAAAVYNPANNTVTLIPTAVLPGNHFYQVIVNGTYGNAVSDTSGNILSGSTGPNTNYDVYYGRGTSLRYIDASNNAVTVAISGGGIEEIFRNTSGNATDINLVGINPRHTKLTGSVKKLAKTSSGHTFIGTITGLGAFGDVRSSLTTPGFYVITPPVLTPLPGTVSASSVSVGSVIRPAITLAKKIVKGPKAR